MTKYDFACWLEDKITVFDLIESEEKHCCKIDSLIVLFLPLTYAKSTM